ncbi:MAG: hypothetical protein IMZ53_16050, partial [Thermoplasmata archaeon]|nr:hypothetical protein [Thermoplasmata archaeon]
MKKIISYGIVFFLIIGGFGVSGTVEYDETKNSVVDRDFTSFNDVSAYRYQLALGRNTISRIWSIVATFPIIADASGLAYDGTYLYCGIYGVSGNNIYRINPQTGSYSLLFTGPQEDAYGLTYDGQYLWVVDHPGS